VENGYMALLEARSDWLLVETLFIAKHLGIEIDDVPKLGKQIRRVFQKETEKIADEAITYNQIEMGDLADAVKKFYNVLPNDMFEKIPVRSKSCVK
jgi:hypothetical protein